MATLDSVLRDLRAPEPGTDAYDALDGMPALEYKLALTPDQVRDIRDALTEPGATLVALGAHYGVPAGVVGNIKQGRAYGWVRDAADGSEDLVPALAFQLSDAAIEYIRDRGGSSTNRQLADRLNVSESAVSRIRNGSRSGGWRKQNHKSAVLSPTPNMCRAIQNALSLGLRATEIEQVVASALDVELPKGWIVNVLFRPPASAHDDWVALSAAYEERRSATALERERTGAEIAAAGPVVAGSRTLSVEVETAMLRAVGADLSPRQICASAGLHPNRIHYARYRMKAGMSGGMIGRIAAACNRRQSERQRYVSILSRKLASALKQGRPSLSKQPRPWRDVCRDLFVGVTPDDFDLGAA